MPTIILSTAEFIEAHGGNPIYVPQLGRKVMPDGASLEQMPWGGEQYPPPLSDFQRLKILIARQSVLIERAREEFHTIRQEVYLRGNGDAAVEMVRQAKQKHDHAYRELERLQAELRQTPEEVARLKALAERREADRRWMDEHARVQGEVGSIQLCSQEHKPQSEDDR